MSTIDTQVWPHDLRRKGGAWVAAARGWIQTRFRNGDSVTWGSTDLLQGAPVTVADIEQVAAEAAAAALNETSRKAALKEIPRVAPLDQYENALVQYLKRSSQARLTDIIAIYGWRCEINPDHISIVHMTESIHGLCARCGLLGNPFDLLADASPDSMWRFGLSDAATEENSHPTTRYWAGVIGVLCSRLRMAEVAKLPGYNHEAAVGPFRFTSRTLSTPVQVPV